MAFWLRSVTQSNIADIAKINGVVISSKVPGAIVMDANEAFVGAIASPTSPGESKVMTLIVPHDRSWERIEKASISDAIRRDVSVPVQQHEDQEHKEHHHHLQSPEPGLTKRSVAERMCMRNSAELLDAKDVRPAIRYQDYISFHWINFESSSRYAAMLREEFHLDIRPTVMYDYTMVWDLVEYIESRLAIENKNDVVNNLSSASWPSRESNNVTKDTTTTTVTTTTTTTTTKSS